MERRDWNLKRFVEEPRHGGKTAAIAPELEGRIEFVAPEDACQKHLIEHLLVPVCAAAMRDRLIKRGEAGEGRGLALFCRIAQMLVEPAMRFPAGGLIRLPQSLAEPFAHQRMRIERSKRCRVLR